MRECEGHISSPMITHFNMLGSFSNIPKISLQTTMRLFICSSFRKCDTQILHTGRTFSSSFKVRWTVDWERLKSLANWRTERRGSSLIRVVIVFMLICVTKERFLPQFSGFKTADSRPSLNWRCHQKIVRQANKASPYTPFISLNISVAVKPRQTQYCTINRCSIFLAMVKCTVNTFWSSHHSEDVLRARL